MDIYVYVHICRYTYILHNTKHYNNTAPNQLSIYSILKSITMSCQGVSNDRQRDCLVRLTTKNIFMLRITGHLRGEFPSQMATNAESVLYVYTLWCTQNTQTLVTLHLEDIHMFSTNI